jgi:hypothetical protein
MKNILLILVLTALLAAGCTKTEKPSNYFGGAERFNYYPNKEFLKYTTQEFFLTDSKDSLVGFAYPVLLLQRNLAVGVLNNGKILFYHKYQPVNELKLPKGLYVASRIAADKENNIYAVISNGALNSYSQIGKKRWTYKLENAADITSYSDVLCTEENIYFGTDKGDLYKLSQTGKKIWKFKSTLSIGKIISADKGENIAVILNSGSFDGADSIVVLNKDGKKLWEKGFANQKITGSVLIGDDCFYCGTYSLEGTLEKGNIYKFGKSGNVVWNKEIPVRPRWVSLDGGKMLFISGYNTGVAETFSGVFAISDKGDLKWKMYFKSTIHSPVLVSDGNAVVCGLSQSGTALFIMDKTSGKVSKTVPLNDFAPLFLYPSVTDDNSIVLTGSSKTTLLRLSDDFLKKFNVF